VRAEDPEDVERGDIAIEWGSDALVELLSRLDLRYIALVPGSSYRGLHDSLVNYNGNRDPRSRPRWSASAQRAVRCSCLAASGAMSGTGSAGSPWRNGTGRW
jgi:hypothetical protein